MPDTAVIVVVLIIHCLALAKQHVPEILSAVALLTAVVLWRSKSHRRQA